MNKTEARFWSKVERLPDAPGCWLWTGAVNACGYGTSGHPVVRKTALAHRLAYEWLVGPIPAGMCVLHSCDVPSCVNPSHLRLGTQYDNAQDRERRRRGRHAAGAAHGRAKLSEDDVRQIRRSPLSHTDEASRFGVSRTLVRKVRDGDLWGHVA